MSDAAESLMLDFLEWLDNGDREYAQVMEVWRTSCPRFPIWEDANDRGLVKKTHANGESTVAITPTGRTFLRERRARNCS